MHVFLYQVKVVCVYLPVCAVLTCLLVYVSFCPVNMVCMHVSVCAAVLCQVGMVHLRNPCGYAAALTFELVKVSLFDMKIVRLDIPVH